MDLMWFWLKQTKCLPCTVNCPNFGLSAVNGKAVCLAGVNHVSYRVRSRGFSSLVDDRRAACWCQVHALRHNHNPTTLAWWTPVNTVKTSGGMICALICFVAIFPFFIRLHPFEQDHRCRPTLAQTATIWRDSCPYYFIYLIGFINSTVKVV